MPDKGLAHLQAFLDAIRERSGQGGSNLAGIETSLAQQLLAHGQPFEAEIVARDSLANYSKRYPNGPLANRSKSVLGRALAEQQRFAEAEPLLLDGYLGLKQHQTRVTAQDNVKVAEALLWIVELYDEQGDRDKANLWREKLVAQDVSRNLVAEEVELARSWAFALRESGRFDSAARMFHRLFALREETLGKTDADTIDAENHWGWALAQSGQYEEAEQHLLTSYQNIQATMHVQPDWSSLLRSPLRALQELGEASTGGAVALRQTEATTNGT